MTSKQTNRYENNTKYKNVINQNVKLDYKKNNQQPNDLQITLYSYIFI